MRIELPYGRPGLATGEARPTIIHRLVFFMTAHPIKEF